MSDTTGSTSTIWLELADTTNIERVRFRRPRGDDADHDAMAAVITVACREDGVPWAPTGAHRREELEGAEGIDLDRDVVVTEADFVSLFSRARLDTDLWVVAWDGDEVAGVLQNWILPEENRTLGIARGWLEHISVRRGWRRRGLGRAITAEELRRLRAAGMIDAALGVDADNPTGALGLYEGLGFEVDQRSTAYWRPLPG